MTKIRFSGYKRSDTMKLLVVAIVATLCVLSACSAQTPNERLHRHRSHDKTQRNGDPEFFLGTGIYDMTGPAAQLNFMGYAKSSQTAHGIHLRLRSRAFIVAELPETAELQKNDETVLEEDVVFTAQDSVHHPMFSKAQISKLDPEKTICFVSIDAGMGSDLLNIKVVKRLQELLPIRQSTGKPLCHLENLSISGTHTHSAPAGFIQYALYQITSSGFSTEVLDTFVEGIAQSIFRAYNNLEPGTIQMAKNRLLDANINRSPTSYLLNPEEERQRYKEDQDTDKTMLQLKMSSVSGDPKGILNWFAVHGTSMNATNLLISSDNKGYASYLMEKYVNGNDTLPGKGSFVAAFASTNLGDVSPNTAGPRCLDTGLPCDLLTSTCNLRNALCVAFGPGQNMKESTEIIGRKQFDSAVALFHGDMEALSGTVSFRHAFIDMSNKTVTLDDGSIGKTCPAALGYAFAAGTTDGPGDFDFTQGQNSSSAFWRIVSGFLSPPSAEQKQCHHPKLILLNTGKVSLPYKWDPDSVPISVMRVGRLFILSVPCEFTTMAGRRLRKAIREIATQHGIDEPEVTIAGLANSYTHYVTTFEEYQGQRYEAASTLYGPHTLSTYIQEFKRITGDMLSGNPSSSDGAPNDLSHKQISLIPPVVVDTIAVGHKFGSVAVNAKDVYTKGKDEVMVSFRSANPRNNQKIEDTFLKVDRQNDDGSWDTMFVDGDWCTTYFWKSSVESLGTSMADITWTIPPDAPSGNYRICHFGTRKKLISRMERFASSLRAWFSVYIIGPIGGGLGHQTLELTQFFSLASGLLFTDVDYSRKENFSGCSRTFRVQD